MTKSHPDFSRYCDGGLPSVYHEPGTVIFEEGMHGAEMFIVRSGRVVLTHRGEELFVVGAGGIFGEMALIDGAARSATATTPSGCTLYLLNERAFLFLIQKAPHFALQVMGVISERLRLMNER